jgi:hypothetical protein
MLYLVTQKEFYVLMGETPKRKPGRPKTSVSQKLSAISFDLQKIETMAALGMTDVQIASLLGVCEDTLTTWKKHPEFIRVLKKGKDSADSKVVESLYRRATGYDHEDTYFSSYMGVVSATPYTKHYAPDPTSMIFWLKNRMKDEWRDAQDITSNGKTITAVNVTVVKKK